MNQEVELRRTIIDSMSDNLMKHEVDNMEMERKLTLMKNQVMEYDRHLGMNRKYGAVKISTLKNIPCTVSSYKS